MADISLIIDVQQKGVVKAVKDTKTLENNVKLLSKSYKSGELSQRQYYKGLRQLATATGKSEKELKAYGNAIRRSERATNRAKIAQDAEKRAIREATKARREAAAALAISNRESAKAAKAARDTATANRRLRMEFKEGYAARVQLRAAQMRLSQAHRQGIINADEYQRQLLLLNRTVGQGGRHMSRAGVLTQQAGYQMGDFLVQIQGGTDAFVAFGQQATQMVGTLTMLGGRWVIIGSVLGVVIPLVTALGAAFSRTGTDASFLGDSLSTISPILDAISAAASYLKEVFLDTANVIVNNLDRAIVYGLALSSFFAGKLVYSFIAAKVAALGFVGALTLMKTALIRTGIGALIVLAGELVYQFVRLVKGAGGFGQAMILVKNAAMEAFHRMGQKGLIFGQQVKAIYNGLKYDALIWLNALDYQFSKTMDKVASSMNNVFGTSFDTGRVTALVSELTPEVVAIRSETALTVGTIAALRAELAKPWTSIEALKGALAETTSDIDVRDWDFSGGDDDDGGATESALQKMKEELALMEELVGKSEEYKYVRETMGDEYDNLSAKSIAYYEGEYQRIQALMEAEENRKAIIDTVAQSLTDGLTAMVEGTKSVKDAFKDMAREIIKQLWEIFVIKQITGAIQGAFGGPSAAIVSAVQADGGAWSGGKQMQAFANGGVVSGPTTFGMAGGKTGLMGEAGPEAIMPLKRGANGKLGVEASGGGGSTVINQHFNFSANGDESVKKIIAQAAPQIAQMTQKSMMDQRRRGGAMKATFG